MSSAGDTLLTRRSSLVSPGVLIVNADDWGQDSLTTDTALECIRRGAVSSVSAMVFMADSERAAGLAGEWAIEAGLHLNLTTPFSAPTCPLPLARRQQELARYLSGNRVNRAVFHPGLARTFAHVVRAQIAEFRRLYGVEPTRFDGHHHMHLCANILLQRLLPAGTLVRRSFAVQPGQTGPWQRLYRRGVDGLLARRHHMVDFFFDVAPLRPAARLQRIASLARRFAVEVETHPVRPEEYRFLAGGEMARWSGGPGLQPPSALLSRGRVARGDTP
jgi:hypothetical protein